MVKTLILVQEDRAKVDMQSYKMECMAHSHGMRKESPTIHFTGEVNQVALYCDYGITDEMLDAADLVRKSGRETAFRYIRPISTPKEEAELALLAGDLMAEQSLRGSA